MTNVSVERRRHEFVLWQKIVSEINQLRAIDERANAPVRADIVIIGAGVSALALMRQLRALDHTQSILIINAESHQPYNRAQLSSVLSDGKNLTHLLQPHHAATLFRHGVSVLAIDHIKKYCHLSDDSIVQFQQLVFATGALPQRFAPLNVSHPRVLDFRGLGDLQQIAVLQPQRIVVVGGGLLGVEAARALRVFCPQITLIERAAQLLPQQLDEGASARVVALLQDWGIDVRLNQHVTAMHNDDDAVQLTLSTTEKLTTDVVVCATGVKPNRTLAQQSGLVVERGIVVDAQHRTSIADVFAIGECCEQNGRCVGSVTPCLQHAETLAHVLAKRNVVATPRLPLTQLKLAQRTVVTLGDNTATVDDTVIFTDIGGRYRKLQLRENIIVAAIIFDHADADFSDLSAAAAHALPLDTAAREHFQRYGRLPPRADHCRNTTLCFCANVSYDDIKQLQQQQLSRADIISRTGASTHCGSCFERLNSTLGQTSRLNQRTLIQIASAITVLMLVATLSALALPFATSWQSPWRFVDYSWRDDVVLQCSGYALLLVVLAAFVWGWQRQRRRAVALTSTHTPKRWTLNVHIVLSISAIVLWLAHTGGRSGQGLNRYLFITFMATLIIGAITGQGWLVQQQSLRGQRIAARLRVLHFACVLPLPALLVFHVLKHYYF